MLHDWLKQLGSKNKNRSKTKPIVTGSHTYSRALRQLRVITSFDWFTELPVSFVTGQSDYFGFWFYDTHWTFLAGAVSCPISDHVMIRILAFSFEIVACI